MTYTDLQNFITKCLTINADPSNFNSSDCSIGIQDFQSLIDEIKTDVSQIMVSNPQQIDISTINLDLLEPFISQILKEHAETQKTLNAKIDQKLDENHQTIDSLFDFIESEV